MPYWMTIMPVGGWSWTPFAGTCLLALSCEGLVGGSTDSEGPDAAQGGRGAGGAEISGAGQDAAVGGASSCSLQFPFNTPSPSDEDSVIPRDVDPKFTCRGADCPIVRALDWTTTGGTFFGPWMAPTADGALVALNCESGDFHGNLLTVSPSEARVAHVVGVRSKLSSIESDSSGSPWLIPAVGGSELAVIRGGATGWTALIVVENDNYGYYEVMDGYVVDENSAYLVYYDPLDGFSHLATWDGSCWTNERLGDTTSDSMAMAADTDGRPWLMSSTFLEQEGGYSIDLRKAGTEPVAEMTTEASWVRTPNSALRMLPGGFDGTAPSPLMAVQFDSGIEVLTVNPGGGAEFSQFTLPSSVAKATVGTCPPPDKNVYYQACEGLTTCSEAVKGLGAGFELIRAPSGSAYAVWFEYSMESTYSLVETCHGVVRSESNVEQPVPEPCDCNRTQTDGTGTAELVLRRLTDTNETTETRFRFDTGGIVVPHGTNALAAAVRDGTLLVAAELTVSEGLVLSYLEFDISQLP
jgi:hypothetical protein